MTFENRQLQAHAHMAAGRPAAATMAAISTIDLPGRPTVEQTVDLARLLQTAGVLGYALAFAVRMRRMQSAFRPEFAFLIGDILDDLGQHQAAVNHLRHALRLSRSKRVSRSLVPILNTIGHVLLFGLRDPAAARPYFTEALSLDENDQKTINNHLICLLSLDEVEETGRLLARVEAFTVTDPALARLLGALRAHTDVRVVPGGARPTTTHRCDECRAEFTVTAEEHLCGACAAVVGGPFSDPCPCCQTSSFSPINVLPGIAAACPVCRAGRLLTTGQRS